MSGVCVTTNYRQRVPFGFILSSVLERELQWGRVFPTGPFYGVFYLESRPASLKGSTAQDQPVATAIAMVIGFIIGAIIGILIDIAVILGFTGIMVGLFDLNFASVREVLPPLWVLLAGLLSIGMIIGAFRVNSALGFLFIVLRLVSLYVAYFTAVIGLYLYGQWFGEGQFEFVADPWLPGFIELGTWNISDTIGGIVVGKLVTGVLTGIAGKKAA